MVVEVPRARDESEVSTKARTCRADPKREPGERLFEAAESLARWIGEEDVPV